MKQCKQVISFLSNSITAILCFISYRLYYAPILMFVYWQSYVDDRLDTQGPYLYYIQYIQHEFGNEMVRKIEERSLFVAEHKVLFFIATIVMLAVNVFINKICKTNRVTKCLMFILCGISLIMIGYIALVAAPYVIDYYYEN